MHACHDDDKYSSILFDRRPFGDEPEFFVQLFVEFSESVQLPTIGHLLHSMFTEQKLSFTKVSITIASVLKLLI